MGKKAKAWLFCNLKSIVPFRLGMLIRSFLFALVVLASGMALGQAQPERMSGMVVDSATYVPLPYVSIQVKNTSRGTISDAKGKFTLMAQRTDTLQFFMLGYEQTEIPLYDWETNVVPLAERSTLLRPVVIQDTRLENSYALLFSEEYAAWRKSNRALPFYYSRWKKEKILVRRAQQEQIRTRTYVDVVIKNPDTKEGLMKKYSLTEDAYYKVLTRFNEESHTFMYYLTAPELLTTLHTFFEQEAERTR
ncbi:MAG: carboxypeptidase-like regulatory domain-containing protein [Bacteroidota bacterium]